ncbi:MAG: type I DNA topoisomerase [Bacilli bacterium]|nr:type I DNA topoisomerase [Bacilli bacterium]
MSKNLVIVESPTKTKAIEKYLGTGYKVVSSKGHIRDLATTGKYGLGVDIENHFEPNYIAIKGKKKDITALKKDADKSSMVYLATDPDREGEAISWHLKDALCLEDSKYKRVVFNEITKDVVKDAFNHAREIDMDLVHSQEARRILDRIIGFRLSKLMQSKTGGKSAGRVQSVALKLIVDKEREIENFKEEEYWSITAIFDKLEANLDTFKGEKIELKTEKDADNVLNNLGKDFIVTNFDKKLKKKSSKYPFITSTMQQDASNKLGFSARKTMQVAQKLYEGIDIENDTIGLITYMRTDSVRLSDEFIKSAYAFIDKEYGKEYVGYVKKSKKKENVQDAHEAIRPSSINRTPESLKKYLSKDEYKLYEMIYYRALASLMSDAKVNSMSLYLKNNDAVFKATGQTLVFDGYLKVYGKFESSDDKIIPEYKVSDVLNANDVKKEQHFTKPPARFTEAKLIKTMEELGIGRPSTYASTITTLTQRGYVKIIEKKLNPTEIGIVTTDKLQEFFSDLINVKYTAKMEDDLDKIADGNKVWYKLLESFYKDFEPAVKGAFDNMEKKEDEKTGEVCPNCGKPMVVKTGKYGKFEACSGYPECKYIKPKEKAPQKEVCDCPKCGGKIVERKTKKGKIFYGCGNFPKCKVAVWDKPVGELCPECHSLLVETKDKKIKCSACDYEK